MKFIINLPFSKIVFVNAIKTHKVYFENLFFSVAEKYPKPKYKITVIFEQIDLFRKNLLYLEEDTSAAKGKLYVSDTKGNKVAISPDLFSKTNITLKSDPDFDLYFLYNYIIEPLLIIWAAEHGILYIHASAVWKDGSANVFPAWRHTGKTSSIFSLAKENIKFMGDDFCVLYNSKVYLYPKCINIFSYNFESYPWLYNKLSAGLAFRIKLSVYLKKFLYFVSQSLTGSISKIFFRLSELAEISTNTKVAPSRLGLTSATSAVFTYVTFMTKASRATKKSKKLKPQELKQKLLAITLYEIRDFLGIYQKYKYLYPDSSQYIIDSFEKNYLMAVNKNLQKAYDTQIVSLPNNDAFFGEVKK